ncbi:hypothetical protein BDY19DRAFT_888596 [Irpex rosettiformis]|uniref:Uncharacterized protein n=1 Tax=Irpex rosettiformis TaxID=378272 RepID=A0ACB8U736_9APHY|nr:hypothetical protein BDY19DRAFT_888596 [Irpex rosettiformis]
MHNLFLGAIRHHCREVLGIDTRGKQSEGQTLTSHTPEEQSNWIQEAVKAIREGRKSRLSAIRKGYIVAIAELNQVEPQDGSTVKKAYVEALISQFKGSVDNVLVPPVLEEPTSDFRLITRPSDWKSVKLLTQPLLMTIREDISRTRLPSWATPPSRNFGDVSQGKLKAAEWHTIATVSLLITLVRLWGGASATKRQKQMLENFLYLVSAVRVGTEKPMCQELAENFDHYFYEYLQTLRKSFEQDLVPNHHLALHLCECLTRFGPVQGWWAFPFERYNGLIARIKTNNRTRDMPTTFLRYFCMGATLHWKMAIHPWPRNKYFADMLADLRNVFGYALANIPGLSKDQKETSNEEFNQEKALPLSNSVYRALLQNLNSRAPIPYLPSLTEHDTDSSAQELYPDAQMLLKAEYEGISYGCRGRRNERNSFVMFQRRHGVPATAGQIVHLFRHMRQVGEVNVVKEFCVVHAFEQLSDVHAQHDFWRSWPDVQARLHYERFERGEDGEPVTHVFSLKEVVSQYAAYTYIPEEVGESCILSVSLRKVRHLLRVSQACNVNL